MKQFDIETERYVFGCPLHGIEDRAFCWRAFQIENIHLWKRMSVTVHDLREEDIIKVEQFVNGGYMENPSMDRDGPFPDRCGGELHNE